MKRKLTSAIIIKISFVLISYLFSVLSAVSLADDLKPDNFGDRVITVNILPENMAISYLGRSANDRASDQAGLRSVNEDSIFLASFAGAAAIDRPEPVFFSSTDDSRGLGKRIKEFTTYVLKYVNVDVGDDDELNPHFESKNENKTNAEMAKAFDLNLSFNLGYNDISNNVSVSAIKLSSYFLFTHLDAVYDSNNDGIDFFLSNAVLNTYLMDGMKLEFKVSTINSSGAVLLSMPL